METVEVILVSLWADFLINIIILYIFFTRRSFLAEKVLEIANLKLLSTWTDTVAPNLIIRKKTYNKNRYLN